MRPADSEVDSQRSGKSNPGKRKRNDWSAASQGTKPITSFFGGPARNNGAPGPESSSAAGKVSAGAGTGTSENAGAEASGQESEQLLGGKSRAASPHGKVKEESGRGSGAKAISKVGRGPKLLPGQMRLSVAHRLPFVPPRRIAGGAPESATNADLHWNLQRPPPAPKEAGPPATEGAQGATIPTAEQDGDAAQAGAKSVRRESKEKEEGGGGKRVKCATTYQAVGGFATGHVQTVRTSFDLSDHFEQADDAEGSSFMAANVRRGLENLSGRTGGMPLVEEEPVEAGQAPPRRTDAAEAGPSNWQALGAQSRSDGPAEINGGRVGEQAGGVSGMVQGGNMGEGVPREPRPAPPVLSEEQRRAATSAFNTPLMIIAGAGTGKTQTMAVRVVEMIRQGIPPGNILALSFTNKAAAELEERIGRIYWGSRAQDKPPVDLSKLTVSTFHSLGLRWVRIFHRALGFEKMPAVYEKRQKEFTVAQCLEQYKRDEDRKKACGYLKMRGDAPWQRIFDKWRETSPDSYRQCEDAVRKKLEENRRKRKKKQDTEAKQKQKVARTDEGGSGRGRGRGRGGRGRGGAGGRGRGAGPQEERPESSDRGGACEQGAEPNGSVDVEESDVTMWENELADAVFHEIWLWELRKNVKHKEGTEKSAWEARWKGVPKAKYIVKDIERAKTYGHTAHEYPQGVAAWSDVFHMYEKKMREANAVDFDDMLRLLALLLDGRTCRAAKRRFQAQFKYVLVDECQDTNSVQSKIVQSFYESMPESSITVVGDDDQSIYGFRGANSMAFTLFMDHYFGVERSLLQENYRSTANILKVGGAVIRDNVQRVVHKTLRPTKAQGDPVLVVQAGTEEDEAAWVANKIAETMAEEGNTRRFRDFALLLRNFRFGKQGSVSTVFQQALQRRRIPYKLTGGQSIYERKEILDVMAYLELILDGDNDAAFERVCNKPPRGMNPAKDKSQTMTVIRAVKGQLENRGERASLMASTNEALRRGDLDGASAGKARRFADVIEELRDFATWHSVVETTREVLRRTGYAEYARKERENERKRKRKQAGRRGEREESFDSDDEDALEGGKDADPDTEAVLSDEEDADEAMETEGGKETAGEQRDRPGEGEAKPKEEADETGRAEAENGEGGTEKAEEEAGHGEEAAEAEEKKELGEVLFGFVREAEHFGRQWSAGVPPDVAEAIPSLYTLCQMKICEYTQAGYYDCQDVRAGVAEGMADDIFATQRLGLSVLRDFGSAIALQKEENAAAEGERDAVTISTIHRAKGLEWPVVFVPRWNEGFFPTQFREQALPLPPGAPQPPGKDELGHIEEERRLAHVACTRAKDQLFISYIRILAKFKTPEELEKSSFPLPEDPAVCHEIVLEESEEEAAARDRVNATRPNFVGFRFAGGFV
ncbi:UvrD/REP type putative DNA helicase [Klebsormidium nitens]|uniref:DNA 3'-5' helicase n=1 Tax=Klebsormidium nitens TaxID=105231 RepID=A0A0U9HIH9_KLENI|nr:UvrD/REP type putative DNA helicase [Klebsormidium nitens]|eukprot:GAQ80746.1 UvrD/REP type putative DNA helicase [Klebsormidium nitens]